MTCNECIDLLPMLALGEGPIDRRRDLEAHLAACSGCSEQFRRLSDICRVLTEDAQSADLSGFERMRLESAVYRQLAVNVPARHRFWNRPLSLVTGVVAGFALFVLGYYSHSFVAAPKSPGTVITTESANSSLAAYDGELDGSLRFSAAGLKAIANGRKAALKTLDNASTVHDGTH